MDFDADSRAVRSEASWSGAEVEEWYRRATSATPPDRASDGDANLDGNLVEVKKASANTINQVRAVKYLPVAVYVPGSDTWHVVPPDEIVRLVARKRRGQHGENPFECATLTVAAISGFAVPDETYLRDATLSAVRQGQRFPHLESEMRRILGASRALAEASVKRTQALLDQPAAPDTGP